MRYIDYFNIVIHDEIYVKYTDNIITTYDVILLLEVQYVTLRVRRQLKNTQPPA
jgi:hypothetical protein